MFKSVFIFLGKIALPKKVGDEVVQALQYEVEDGMELVVQFDPKNPEVKSMKLYNAKDLTKPMKALAQKNFPKKNYFAGHYGTTERARKFRAFITKLRIKFAIEGLFSFEYSSTE